MPPRLTGGSSSTKTLLSTKTEATDEAAVALNVVVPDVGQKTTATTNEAHETAAGVVVTFVHLEVPGEVVDALGEKRNLDLGRAGVGVVLLVFGDGGGLLLHVGGQASSNNEQGLAPGKSCSERYPRLSPEFHQIAAIK